MDLRDQVLQFRNLLQKKTLDIDDFELNVDGDAFRKLLSGGGASLEVHRRSTGVTIVYHHDGTSAWLEALAADLEQGGFRETN